jgi:hypothetical protein
VILYKKRMRPERREQLDYPDLREARKHLTRFRELLAEYVGAGRRGTSSARGRRAACEGRIRSLQRLERRMVTTVVAADQCLCVMDAVHAAGGLRKFILHCLPGVRPKK